MASFVSSGRFVRKRILFGNSGPAETNYDVIKRIKTDYDVIIILKGQLLLINEP